MACQQLLPFEQVETPHYWAFRWMITIDEYWYCNDIVNSYITLNDNYNPNPYIRDADTFQGILVERYVVAMLYFYGWDINNGIISPNSSVCRWAGHSNPFPEEGIFCDLRSQHVTSIVLGKSMSSL